MQPKFEKMNRSGFTLVEIMVSVVIFSFVMLMVASMLLAIVQANAKAQTLKTTLDNLNISLDEMSRTIRTGSYYGGTSCADGTFTSFKFTNQEGVVVTYSYDSASNNGQGSIDRVEGVGGQPIAITGTDVGITSASFNLENCSASNNTQPYVIIIVKGSAGIQPNQSTFNIETTISKRGIGNSVYSG
jgi:prepilin-type N-terminal cleavage/methylation domain-containing protein